MSEAATLGPRVTTPPSDNESHLARETHDGRGAPATGDNPQQNAHPTAAAPKLQEQPDWAYLLREFREMYRHSSAGGSTRIGSHQRRVRALISKASAANPSLAFEAPRRKPVVAHLKRALDNGRLLSTAPLIRAVESIADNLDWKYGYERVPKALAERYAYAEILGPNGPIVFDDLILGLVLFAPKCVYPAHSHAGITESYYCLSGAVSENDDGVYAPGSMIYNPPGRNHRITVCASEPCLLAYAWEGPSEKLVGHEFSFNRGTSAAKK
ncbi:MAG: dimethylsulfonioproprionate lyase family protein [Pseudomonadota bacterium]